MMNISFGFINSQISVCQGASFVEMASLLQNFTQDYLYVWENKLYSTWENIGIRLFNPVVSFEDGVFRITEGSINITCFRREAVDAVITMFRRTTSTINRKRPKSPIYSKRKKKKKHTKSKSKSDPKQSKPNSDPKPKTKALVQPRSVRWRNRLREKYFLKKKIVDSISDADEELEDRMVKIINDGVVMVDPKNIIKFNIDTFSMELLSNLSKCIDDYHINDRQISQCNTKVDEKLLNDIRRRFQSVGIVNNNNEKDNSNDESYDNEEKINKEDILEVMKNFLSGD
jgi:hypothetical protein